MRLLPAALAALLPACSSADFTVMSGSDGAVRADTANSVADTGMVVDEDTGGPAQTDAEPSPGCKMPPPPTCVPTSYEPHHDLVTNGTLPVPLNAQTKHFVSFTLSKRGRIEKLGLKMRRNDLGSGSDGTVTVHAFYVPCEDTLIPIGKHTKSAADVPGDTTFYFNPDQTMGLIPFLPLADHDMRIAFIIETTSTRYSWTLAAAPLPLENPRGHQWGSKAGAEPWVGSKSQIAATMSYIRACSG